MTDYEKERFAWVRELTTEEKRMLLEFIMELPSQRGRELEDDRKKCVQVGHIDRKGIAYGKTYQH